MSLLLTAFFSYHAPSIASIVSDMNPPPGVMPGDPFRVMFVTSGTRNAMSSNIADYDAFVQGFAPAGLSTSWRAIGSTHSVDARDHTGTVPGTDGTGIPLFNMHGELIAESYAHLWGTGFPHQSGTLDLANAVTYDESGVSLGFVEVWTGTGPKGAPFRPPGFAFRAVLGDFDPSRP